MQLEKCPVIQVNTLTIDGVSVDPSNIQIYKESGLIKLKNTSSVGEFTYGEETIEINYYWGEIPEYQYGEFDIPIEIKTYCALVTAVAALVTQMGGTFDDLSTFSIPNVSGTVGQAYINIEGTVKRLVDRINSYEKNIVGKYADIM